MADEAPKKKASPARQAVTLVVALGIFAAAAFVILPKFQSTTSGPVRLDLVNATEGSILEVELLVRLPRGEADPNVPGTMARGSLATVYEGLGPVEVESIRYVRGSDGQAVDQPIDRTIEPGATMVVSVVDGAVIVQSSEAPEPSP
ncbi:MAG: hypothetical protein RIB58_07930 [Phycisphaerales bacterium]